MNLSCQIAGHDCPIQGVLFECGNQVSLICFKCLLGRYGKVSNFNFFEINELLASIQENINNLEYTIAYNSLVFERQNKTIKEYSNSFHETYFFYYREITNVKDQITNSIVNLNNEQCQKNFNDLFSAAIQQFECKEQKIEFTESFRIQKLEPLSILNMQLQQYIERGSITKSGILLNLNFALSKINSKVKKF